MLSWAFRCFFDSSGSGAVTFGAPNSPGVTLATAKDTLLADYNDLDSVNYHFEQHPEQIAAIIVETSGWKYGLYTTTIWILAWIKKFM